MSSRSKPLPRRGFLGAAAAAGASALWSCRTARSESGKRPNLVYVFADQWRAQATGYAGDPNALTPNLNALAAESLNFENAVSGCPVCTPYRASLMTGQYWLRHGLFLNDLCLPSQSVSFAEALQGAGYATGYIGKWHLDGHGRSNFIPPERRQGFDFWRAQECTHAYNRSQYYADTETPLQWEGYDAEAQTREAQQYIQAHATDKPFALFLSWGPPHNPYETAPEACRSRIAPERLSLRGNVPRDWEERARTDLAGYYAHIVALDTCLGQLMDTLRETGLENDTVLVFTSDHGDMLGSQGEERKQRPYDEAIRVPFLLRYPARLGRKPRRIQSLLNTPDIMPTLLGLCGAAIPGGVDGHDFSASLLRGQSPESDAALILCVSPFGEWTRAKGGREYRGIRTARHTYVRSLDGPWLLFDNTTDSLQMHNLCGQAEHRELQHHLDGQLAALLRQYGDEFLPGKAYLEQWGYKVDANGTVPYAP